MYVTYVQQPEVNYVHIAFLVAKVLGAIYGCKYLRPVDEVTCHSGDRRGR
jgi:hypothetical protein